MLTMEGSPVAYKIDGIAVDVDPGAHTFVFEGPDGRAEQKVVVPEGTKAQHIGVTFGAAGAAAVVAMTPGVAAAPAAGSSGGFNALPSEPVDSGFSFSFRLGYGIAAGSFDGLNGDSLSNVVSGQIPFWFDAGYLVNPYFYIGAYLSYGIGTGLTIKDTADNIANVCNVSGVGCSASDLRIGVDVQLRLLGKNKLQPWIGLGVLGYESASASASTIEGEASATFTGIEWVNPQVGFDYKILPTLSAGPFFGVSISEYLGESEEANGNSAPATLTSKAIHEWIYIGARVNYDLHI
jgi:hypothetical protein